MQTGFFLAAVATFSMWVATSARAADASWEVRVVPYLWIAGVDGSLSHRGFPLSVNPGASFGDVFSRLDAAGMLVFEAHGDRWGVFGDVIVVDLDDTVRVGLGEFRFPVQVGTETTTALLAAQYRLRETGRSHVDLVGGLRYWSLATRFRYDLPSGVPESLPIPRQYNVSERGWWPDLQVGVKAAHHFDNAFFLSGWALVGAGGADLTTDLMLSVGWDMSPRTSLMLGYRRLESDFSTSGGFAFDARLHGPGLALEVRF